MSESARDAEIYRKLCEEAQDQLKEAQRKLKLLRSVIEDWKTTPEINSSLEPEENLEIFDIYLEYVSAKRFALKKILEAEA